MGRGKRIVYNKPCIPWNPIPEAANNYTDLRMVQFAYHMHRDPLSVIVLAPWHPPGEEQCDVAWRLSFHMVRGFRNRPLGGWAGGTAPPWPILPGERPDGWNGPAMWEVTTSSFLDECRGPTERSAWQHYVVADFDQTYEIVASGWAVEQLPGTWQDHLRYLESEQWPGATPWLPREASGSERKDL